MGYKLTPAGALNAALALAPKVSAISGAGLDIPHSQTNLQLMYGH